MNSSLYSLANVGRCAWLWAALAILGVSLPVLAGEAIPANALYPITYKVEDILSELQSARYLEAAEARDYLEVRVKGPAVAQLDWPKQREVRFGEMRCRDEDLTVVANRAGHEQVEALFAAFRQFGEAEYVIFVRFITLSDARMRDIFPDATSTLLTSHQNPPSSSEPVMPAVAEIPVGREGNVAARSRTVIEEDAPMRLLVLDRDDEAKLIRLVESDRRSNMLIAPKVTTYSGQTASLFDIIRTRFVVGANVLPSGEREPKTQEVAEGTSMQFRPHAEPGGDIRLDFAASFTKIEKVTTENVKLDSGREMTLQIPMVATARIDCGVLLKPGQSLIVGNVKRLAESRSISWTDQLLGRPPKVESQELALILSVEPFEIPNRAAAKVAAVDERD
jgi:hypothetical protein